MRQRQRGQTSYSQWLHFDLVSLNHSYYITPRIIPVSLPLQLSAHPSPHYMQPKVRLSLTVLCPLASESSGLPVSPSVRPAQRSVSFSPTLQAVNAPENPLTALIWPSPSSDQYSTGDNRGVKINTARPETGTQAVIRSDAGALVLVDRRVGDGRERVVPSKCNTTAFIAFWDKQ